MTVRIDIPGDPLTSGEAEYLRDQESKWRDQLVRDSKKFGYNLTAWQLDALARIYAAHDLRTIRRHPS